MPIDFTGEAVAEPARAPQTRLPHRSNAPFYFMHHPLCWDLVDGEWLPSLRKMLIEPGVGGVDKLGGTTLAETVRVKQGWTILPWHLVPADVPGGSYLRRYLAQGPAHAAYFHVSAWERPRALGGRVVDSEIDLEGYRAWLRWLVEEGHVAPITPEAVAFHGDRLSSEITRLEGRVGKVPHVLEELERKREALASLSPAPRKARKRAAAGDPPSGPAAPPSGGT